MKSSKHLKGLLKQLEKHRAGDCVRIGLCYRCQDKLDPEDGPAMGAHLFAYRLVTNPLG